VAITPFSLYKASPPKYFDQRKLPASSKQNKFMYSTLQLRVTFSGGIKPQV